MDNWGEHCQLILKSTYGMDYDQFLDFIIFIAKQRLKRDFKKDEVRSFN